MKRLGNWLKPEVVIAITGVVMIVLVLTAMVSAQRIFDRNIPLTEISDQIALDVTTAQLLFEEANADHAVNLPPRLYDGLIMPKNFRAPTRHRRNRSGIC